MINDTQNLHFPKSGLSIVRAKQIAKANKKSGKFLTLNDALDSISNEEMGLPWGKAIPELDKQLQRNSNLFMSKADIISVMKNLPELTHFGFGICFERGKTREEKQKEFALNRQYLIDSIDECNRACMYLQHIDKRKTINTNSTSYGIKHFAEHYLDELPNVDNPYIANGSLICAAHYMGFDVKQVDYSNPNACINFSSKSPILKWRKLKDKRMYVSPNNIRELDRLEKLLGLPSSEAVINNQYLFEK